MDFDSQLAKGLIEFVKRRAISFTTAGALLTVFALLYFGAAFILVILAAAIVGAGAFAIHRRTLEQKTRQISEASRMHLATVEALATAIDARDQIGMGHVRRTQIYAVGLGVIIGLDESEINALRTGALLHDIGKLAVPDHILNKPGKLTPAELEKTKIHASVGASILDKVGFPYAVVPTVKYHHEYWDGNGYPEGLKGERIPLTARILSIADAYDALREIRPFRPAKTKAEAVQFLRDQAGSQYDPTLVDLFLRNLPEFENEIVSSGLEYQQRENDGPSRQLITNDIQSPNYIEQIKRANREVFTLYSIAREFTSSLELNETLVLFADKVAEFVPYDSIVITLLQKGSEAARTAYAGGANSALLAMRKTIIGQGATGYVLKKHIPVVNVDPAFDLSFISDDELGTYRVMASLPLFADDRMIGAVSIYSSKLDYFQDEHIRLLETVSHIAADAINIALQHAEAETYALTDPMTGLPNSRSLRSQFEKEVERAGRSGKRFQLIVMDLDGFKSVNDNYGHKLGDTMLKAVGGVINGQLREYDFLARYGGDEFVAIVPDTDSEGIQSLHARITDAVSSFRLPAAANGTAARVGISLGSASYPDDGETLDTLIEAADKRMYVAKENNRTRVREEGRVEPSINMEQDGNGDIPTRAPAEEPKVLSTSAN